MTEDDLATAWGGLVAEFRKLDERCDYSDLYVTQCGHCLGHKLDPDLEELTRQ